MSTGQRTRIKICGIRDIHTALTAAEVGADAIGLVFVEPSPRYVSIETAAAIVRDLPAFIEPVGLFVNADTQTIRTTAEAVGISTVQLHGQEHPEQVIELSPLRVIKAMPFDPANIKAIVSQWQPVSSRLAAWIWDCPSSSGDPQLTGGTGQAFDWDALEHTREDWDLALSAPMVIAGGLTPDNVGQAIKTVRPWAVDVSSGVEVERGVKDPTKIIDFCHQVQQADATR